MFYLTKLSQFSHLMTLAVCGAILATIPVEAAFAGPTDPSSYQTSCQPTGVSGATLEAFCRRIDGTLRRTAILIRGIQNTNGKLTYSSNPTASSTYQDSCVDTSVIGATLEADCRIRNGTSRRTGIRIRGIDNTNGKLTYSK
jgi:CVNH domain